ncbi:MAG: hypothetical protein ACK4Q5_04680 [Saprospiraceae bacterium]
MIEAIKTIQDAAQLGINAFQKIKETDGCKYRVVEKIKVSEMSLTHFFESLENQRFWRDLDDLGKLKQEVIERPCLYFFEILNASEERNRRIIETYQEYRNQKTRNCSAVHNKPNFNTSTLYLGKVKHGINGRMIVHFGYGNYQTGGLQLVHWAQKLNLELNLHLFLLPNEAAEFVEPLEFLMSKKLMPLIGKHK